MNFSFLPHPPNSAWLPPLDPNDEVLSFILKETLEQQEAMIEQEFKNILSQDLVGALGTMEMREEDEEEEEDDDGDMDEYTDEIQIPVFFY